MDKYVEALCKQNPKITFCCNNCNKKTTFKTKDVFKNKTYIFTCPNCGKERTADNSKFVKDFIANMKKTGIHVK